MWCSNGRIRTAVQQIREKEPNVIFLSAGDLFKGSVWYTLHKYRAMAHFSNMLDHDAMVSLTTTYTDIRCISFHGSQFYSMVLPSCKIYQNYKKSTSWFFSLLRLWTGMLNMSNCLTYTLFVDEVQIFESPCFRFCKLSEKTYHNYHAVRYHDFK